MESESCNESPPASSTIRSTRSPLVARVVGFPPIALAIARSESLSLDSRSFLSGVSVVIVLIHSSDLFEAQFYICWLAKPLDWF